MQTCGEKHLVEELLSILKGNPSDSVPFHILNIGAGRKVSIENQLMKAGCEYVCDRLDIDDCTVSHPCVGRCWKCPVERMSVVRQNEYCAAFANYVIEHVNNLNNAAIEIYRVLKPGGVFVATLPNVSAPEFKLSKITPLWFHRLIRGHESWETTYLYKSIYDLIEIFECSGFSTLNVQYYPSIETYLRKFPVLGEFGKLYDKLILFSGIKKAMGDVCVVFRKIVKKAPASVSGDANTDA